MALSFPQKSALNEAILGELRMRLLDKETRVIPKVGLGYIHNDPADESLLGSIGPAQDPTWDVPQPPSSMGMVLLVSPDNAEANSPFKVVVNGQFDVSHRHIPDLNVMRNNLKMELGEPAKSQTITFVYKRFTVEFEDVELTFDPAKDLNTWVTPGEDNGLARALKDLELACLKDPRIYRHSHLNDRQTGARFNVDWEEGISLQEDLNGLVERDIFDDTSQVLPYRAVIRARIRKAPSSLTPIPNTYLVEIFLENQVSKEESKYYAVTKPYLLDSQFSSRIHGAKHQLLPHKLSPRGYRYQDGNGVTGYGVTTSVEESAPEVFSTNAMPVSKLKRIENPSPKDLGMSAGAKFDTLANDPAPVISELLAAIDQYVANWEDQIKFEKAAGKAEEVSVLEEDLAAFMAERDNVQAGLDLLEANPDLMQCFKWMNGIAKRAIKRQGKAFDEWRLFQLGFILTQIRAIYERCCDKAELTDHIKHAEVLWFATGGGKTEAYLGILIMAMLFERKNEKLYGPTGWMRFPLRMLSVQQFQRLSYMVAEANMVRQNENLGGHPFTIGYFTGGGTPNSLTSTSGEQGQYFLPLMSDETLKKLKFISDCPYCDEPHTIKVVKNVEDVRIRHVCQNSKCWSNTQADPGRYGEGIRGEVGIYVSDPEVYRYLPTIMVGTVDKLATISLNHRFRGFFGQATHFCPTHGFSMAGACQHHDFEQEDRGEWAVKACPNNTRPKRGVPTKAVPAAPIPGISFMIQDELHLMAENLGNFDAHYESILNAIQLEFGGRPPKVLAATATIKDYAHHVHHLYQREARRFPAPGFTLSESFYSKVIRDDDTGEPMVRRLYAGIMPLGMGSVAYRSSAKVSRRYIALIDELIARFKADGARTSLDLGLEESLAAAYVDHMEVFLTANLLYVNSNIGMSDVVDYLSDGAMEKAPVFGITQLTGNSSLEEIQIAISHMETRKPDDNKRQIVANNVVSHGVDIHRLNMMVIAKWTKSITEYMQVSARAGRIEPGIVVSVIDNRSLFESTVFMDFNDYHRFMDKLVESVPINRFQPNLMLRTLPGVLSAWLVVWATTQPWGQEAYKNGQKLNSAMKNPSYKAQEELKQKIIQTLDPPQSPLSSFDDRVLDDFREKLVAAAERITRQIGDVPPNYGNKQLSEILQSMWGTRPMFSLRDIELQVEVLPKNENDYVDIIEALGN